jgi:hypothetical protein
VGRLDKTLMFLGKDISHILKDVKQENLPREGELFYVNISLGD